MIQVSQQLIAFTGIAAVLTVTPGLDTALVLRTAAVNGGKAAFAAALGILGGCLTWGVAAAFGVSALLAASTTAFTILRWVGAAYLVWMGLGMLRAPRRSFEDEHPCRGDAASPWLWLRRGLLTNLLNPKVGIFYISFLPQFVPAGVAPRTWMILLASIHGALGLAWFALLIAATRPLGRMLRRPAVIGAVDRTTGLILLGFGAKLAFTRR